MSIIRLIVFFILFVALSCKDKNETRVKLPAENKKPVDKIRLTRMDGKPVALNDYRGKTIFLNIWATWCKPCIQEMPSIENAMHILQKEDIVFIMASPESVEEITAFRDSQPYRFDYSRLENQEENGIQGFPTTYIFNSTGELVFSEPGQRAWDEKKNIDMIRKIINKNE